MITKVESNEEYHSQKRYLSSSAVKTINARSVYHLLHSVPYSETEAMKEGTAVHAKMLEPHLFDETYVIMEPFNGRTAAGKAIKATYDDYEANGKILLKAEQGDMINALYDNLQKNPLALEYVQGEVELSHYSEYRGIKVKVRPDVKGVDFISDIKTCQDASPRAFRYEIYKRGYHIQAAFYCEVLGMPLDRFKFIAMQKGNPHDVVVHTLSEKMQEEGLEAMHSALDQWIKYLETGEATSYVWEKAKDGSYIL